MLTTYKKKVLSMIFISLAFLLYTQFFATDAVLADSKTPRLFIQNKLSNGIRIQIKNSTAYASSASLARELGVNIEYRAADNQWIASKGDLKIKYSLSNPTIPHDRQNVLMVKGAMYLPLRDFSERFGFAVLYNKKLNRIDIMESEETKILGQLNREPSTTNEEFTLSSDGKWGVKEILTTIMVQNMENKKKKIIYIKEGQSGDVQWISKNRLLIEDYVKDLKKNFVIIYDCKSDSQKMIFEDKFVLYVPSIDSLIYYDVFSKSDNRSPSKEDYKNIGILNLETMRSKPMRYEEIREYLQPVE